MNANSFSNCCINRMQCCRQKKSSIRVTTILPAGLMEEIPTYKSSAGKPLLPHSDLRECSVVGIAHISSAGKPVFVIKQIFVCVCVCVCVCMCVCVCVCVCVSLYFYFYLKLLYMRLMKVRKDRTT
jgi:hypothetical protein